jgi:acyl carrier protein
MQQNIEQTVRDFILREFLPDEDPRQLMESTPLISGGILDSIATVKLVVFIEQQFKVEVEPHEANTENLETIGSISALVRSKLQGADAIADIRSA